jgi:hypothetical protein
MRMCSVRDSCFSRFGSLQTCCAAGLLAFLSATAFSQEIPQGHRLEDYSPLMKRNPFVLATVDVTPSRPSPFEKLFLEGWSRNDGQEVIFIRDSETNAVERLTINPNRDNLRLLVIHPNEDPQLVEALISDGSNQGLVKFHFPNETGAAQKVGSETARQSTDPVGAGPSAALISPGKKAVSTIRPEKQSPTSRLYPGLPRVHAEGGLPAPATGREDARIRSSSISPPG